MLLSIVSSEIIWDLFKLNNEIFYALSIHYSTQIDIKLSQCLNLTWFGDHQIFFFKYFLGSYSMNPLECNILSYEIQMADKNSDLSIPHFWILNDFWPNSKSKKNLNDSAKWHVHTSMPFVKNTVEYKLKYFISSAMVKSRQFNLKGINFVN